MTYRTNITYTYDSRTGIHSLTLADAGLFTADADGFAAWDAAPDEARAARLDALDGDYEGLDRGMLTIILADTDPTGCYLTYLS